MTRDEAKAIVGTGLGEAKKMPGWSFGIPAARCKTGMRLRASAPNSTCAKCYALRGHYMYPVIKAALERRFNALDDPRWVDAMTTLLAATDSSFFRWHDSGDLQSVSHIAKIAEIARRFPRVKFWLPTREFQIVRDWLRSAVRPKNLIIRLSAHIIDGPMPTKLARELGVLVSGVHKKSKPKAVICEAKKRGNECGPCRACWDSRVFAVSYPQH